MSAILGREDKSAYAASVANQAPPEKAVLEGGVIYRGQYYSVKPPEGYAIADVTEERSKMEPNSGREGTPTGNLLITFKEKEAVGLENPKSFFGPQVMYYNPNEKPAGSWQPTGAEIRSLRGMALTTTTATGIGVPLLGASSVIAVGGAEGVKYGVTGEHLTVDEALFVASAAQTTVASAQVFKPYISKGINVVRNAVSPDRAMANRVFVEGFPSKSPVGSKGWLDSVRSKVTPESFKVGSMYEKVTRTSPQPKASDFGFKMETGGGRQSTLQWVKQTQFVKPQVAKVTAKAWTAPKTLAVRSFDLTRLSVDPLNVKASTVKAKTVKASAKPQTEFVMPTVTQSVKNPFLQYSGRPFVQQQRRDEMEDFVFLSYPSQSPLGSPLKLAENPKLNFRTDLGGKAALSMRPVSWLGLDQSARALSGQALSMSSIQTTKQTPRLTTQQQTRTIPQLRQQSSGFDFPRLDWKPPKRKKSSGVGRQKRVYPIVTGSDVLKGLLTKPSKTRKRGKK